jgi:hypothetical protein
MAKIAEGEDILKCLESKDPLVHNGDDNSSDRFLEVHIYGSLTLHSISKIVLPPIRDEDGERPYLEVLNTLLGEAGIVHEECANDA